MEVGRNYSVGGFTVFHRNFIGIAWFQLLLDRMFDGSFDEILRMFGIIAVMIRV